MLVTLYGIVTFSSELQPENASPPILTTLFPIDILINESQFLNALLFISFTGKSLYVSGIITSVDVIVPIPTTE